MNPESSPAYVGYWIVSHVTERPDYEDTVNVA